MFVVLKAMAVESLSATSAAAAAAAAVGGISELAELEMDQLNQHECMSSLISVLCHMQLKSITPTVEQVTTSLYLNILPSSFVSMLLVWHQEECSTFKKNPSLAIFRLFLLPNRL